MNRVLIYEPDAALGTAFKECLEKRNLWVMQVGDADAARDLMRKQFFHLCLWPISDATAVTALSTLRQLRPFTGIIAVSERAESGLIVACMRSGASNFWKRGESLDSLADVVTETLSRIVPESIQEEEIDFPFPQLVGKHPKILEICQLILSIKNTDSTVLITGESGTGKEVVACAIHGLSPRRRLPWIAVNCGAIPGNLLESELFGHMKGAFTGATQNRMGRFQLAGAGTLFLDEISDLSFDLQAKILRAIQNRQFEPVGSPHSITLEARIIAATNQDLETAVVQKRFREDLYYRLNVIPIYIPPLRSRKSDIPLLTRNFLERFCKINGKEFVGISEEAMKCLMEYHWPGNIRELENLMERVVVLQRGTGVIELKDFRSITSRTFISTGSLRMSRFRRAVSISMRL